MRCIRCEGGEVIKDSLIWARTRWKQHWLTDNLSFHCINDLSQVWIVILTSLAAHDIGVNYILVYLAVRSKNIVRRRKHDAKILSIAAEFYRCYYSNNM